jgi:trimeric autotransporter adhesin
MSARYSSYGVIAAALLLAASARAQEAHYTYDADGRLIAQGPRVDGVAIVGLAPAYGATGTLVSIQGYGFDPVAAAYQVSFGGVMAAVDSATPELIVATVPAEAATGPVTVVAGGKSATSGLVMEG